MKNDKMVFKQDLNFLAYPHWFQVSRANGPLQWKDPAGYVYRADYKAPDQLDQLFLMYLLMRMQQENYASKMDFTRYEILKGCGSPVNPQYLRRLEDSLARWKKVSLSFEQCFYDGRSLISAEFKILDDFRLREDGRLEICLNANYLSHIQHSNYFKYIDFNYYRLLRRPVSRRLLELLTHTFKSSSQWKVPLVELGRRLTLYTRRRKNKAGNQEPVIYPSDVLTAVKAAVDEINGLSTDTDQLWDLGMDPREIYAITYEVGLHKKNIEFHRAPLTHLFDELVQERGPKDLPQSLNEPQLEDLLHFLRRSSRPLRELVTKFFRSHGYDYVKWNIFYANRNGARNYVSYLKLCLQHNWAQEFREEYERMFESSLDQIDERKRAALIKVAEQADHLLMPDGKRFKIKRVFPNGAIEISNRAYKMDFVLSPGQAYGCRFERENPEQIDQRGRKRNKL